MPGMLDWKIKISADIKDLQNKMHKVEGELGEFEGKDHKVKLDLDTKTLESAVKKLDKMLDSIGKGTGDFKQFETLSKDLAKVTSELSGFTKAFGKIDDSGTKSLLNMVQNIDKSLNNLSNHVTDEFLNKITSSVGTVKQKFADIGDGSEFEPLLQMINKIDSSINNLAKETSKIKLNMNLDFGTEMSEKMNQQVSKAVSRQAQAYKNLFETMKGSGKTTEEMIKFSLPENASNSEIVGAYKGVIERAEKQYGKSTYSLRLGSKYNDAKNEIKNANAALRRAEIKRTNSNGVSDLLGGNFGDVINELSKIAAKLDEISSSASGLKSAFETGFNVSASVEEIAQLTNKVKKLEDELQKVKSVSSGTVSTGVTLGNESNISSASNQKKDAFPNSSTNTKPETEGMEQIEKATDEAVQAKKDFATANEGVQSSIDGSENPLKLEAELMERIAKSAREAADAKKEFVEANKQVKDSADASNSDLKSKPKKDRYAKRRKVSEEDFLNYSPNRVNEKLSNSGYTILGETVNTELVDGLVKVSAKIKDVDGVWKSFSAKVDADGNIFEQRFKTVTNGVDKLETALQNFGRETTPALTYQETLDKAQKIKNSLNLGDEYSIKVDSSEFVTITKKLTDVENTGTSVTQTFKSAQDAIDNFGKSASNSAEKTSVALKSVKNNIKEVTDESEKLANAQKEQNVNVNFNKYDKRLDSYNGKIDKYKTTISRFNDGGWTSDAYLKNVQAVKNAVDEYETLLKELKGKDASLVTSEDISKLDNYEKKIKDTIATVTNMSAAEKGYNFVSGQKELDKIHKLLNENSKMSSEAKAKIKTYYKEIESGNPSMSLDRIHGEIMKIYNAEVEAGRAGRSFFDTLKNSGFHQIAAQMAGMFGVYDVINIVKQAASTVTELNTQITELAKVSEQSSKQIYADFDSYADIAKEVRGTISDTIAATADWSKNGYSIPDAKQLAEVSQLYKNVGDGIDINTANESLISTLKGFKLEADQAEHIVDVFNEVSNNEAISSGGIGDALQRSAASFNAANTSLEQSVALVTATNSVLQDPEKVGNMWKTVSARIRGKIVPIYSENYSLCA